MLKKSLLVIALLSVLAVPAFAGHQKEHAPWPTGTSAVTVTYTTSIATKDWKTFCDWSPKVYMLVPYFLKFDPQGNIDLQQIAEERNTDNVPLGVYHYRGETTSTVTTNPATTWDIKAQITANAEGLKLAAQDQWYVKLNLNGGAWGDLLTGVANGDTVGIQAGVHNAKVHMLKAGDNVHVATVDLIVRPSC
jgi:hypothetical protein